MPRRRGVMLVPNPATAITPGLQAVAKGTSEIDLTILPGDRLDITGYRFDAAPTPNGPWSTVSNQTSPIAAHNGLSAGTTVYYRGQITYSTGRKSNFSSIVACSTAGSLLGNALSQSTATGALTTGGSPSTKMKLINGSIVWADNQFLAGQEMTTINANFGGVKNNTLIKGLYVSATWGDLEGPTQGDYSRGFGFVDQLIGASGLLTTANHAMAIMLEVWQTFFNTTTFPSPSHWPQYVVNNGWVKKMVSQGNNRTQLDWDNDAVWTAFTNMCKAYIQRYNGNQYFAGFSPMDESVAISFDESTNSTVLNSTHYNAKFKQLILDLKAVAPNIPIYACLNYLPPGGSTEAPTMADMIRTWYAAYPTGICYGGPDPFVRQTTFQKLVAGLYPDLGDVRKQLLIVQRVQEAFLGNVKDANGNYTKPGNTPLQLYDSGVANNAVILGWNFENYLYYKWTDQLAAITTRGGVVGTPPAGNYTII